MDSDQTPINGSLKRRRRRPAALVAGLGGFREKAAGAALALRAKTEGAELAFRERVAWPLEDRFATLSPGGRIAATAASALTVALLAVVAIAIAGSGGSSSAPSTTVAVAPAPAAEASAAAEPKPATPTLHGAPPVFKPAPKQSAPSEVDPAQAIESPPAAEGSATGSAASGSASAATQRISSRPSSAATTSSASASAAAEPATVPGRPAGPKAIAVANRFAAAFVVYETGGEESTVRREFAQTTTTELAKALLKRPPRLPAEVKVPKAKVVNVVPGPSRDGVYTLSVSLLRVGVTSELRLEMERLKDEGWRVTNVLG